MAAESPAAATPARDGETAFLTPPSTTQASRNSPAPPPTAPPARYRQAAQLPFELAHHCSVYLESGQYIQGYSLLTSLLRSGSWSSSTDCLPAQIPPVQLLELSATLAVYPAVTTRAPSADLVYASNAAVRYLRDVNRVVGPVNAGLANAFVFHASGLSRSRQARKRGFFDPSANGENRRVDDERPIKSAVANQNSLWAKGDDFWHVLGWAFNCSVKHKQRWERWSIWLELMLEVMEDDWKERNKLYDEQHDRDATITSDELLEQSIFVQYLVNANVASLSARRRILRAILADGGSKSNGEFKEVFKNELLGKKAETVKPIKEVKLEEGDLGDLEDPEDDDMDEVEATGSAGLPFRRSGRNTNTRRASVISLSSDSSDGIDRDATSPVERLGGMDALRLRQRFLAFLAIVTERLPAYVIRRDQLFDSFTEHLRPLPTSVFATLIRTSALSAPAQCILAANTLLPLLPHSPPCYTLAPPSQAEWGKHFIPFAANKHSFADNAKITILLHQVIQISLRDIEWSEDWVAQIIKGIRARKVKARGLNKAGGGGLRSAEMVAKKIFRESEQLLLLLVQMIEDDANVPPRKRPKRDDLISEVQSERVDDDSASDLSSAPSDSELEVIEAMEV